MASKSNVSNAGVECVLILVLQQLMLLPLPQAAFQQQFVFCTSAIWAHQPKSCSSTLHRHNRNILQCCSLGRFKDVHMGAARLSNELRHCFGSVSNLKGFKGVLMGTAASFNSLSHCVAPSFPLAHQRVAFLFCDSTPAIAISRCGIYLIYI